MKQGLEGQAAKDKKDKHGETWTHFDKQRESAKEIEITNLLYLRILSCLCISKGSRRQWEPKKQLLSISKKLTFDRGGGSEDEIELRQWRN